LEGKKVGGFETEFEKYSETKIKQKNWEKLEENKQKKLYKNNWKKEKNKKGIKITKNKKKLNQKLWKDKIIRG